MKQMKLKFTGRMVHLVVFRTAKSTDITPFDEVDDAYDVVLNYVQRNRDRIGASSKLSDLEVWREWGNLTDGAEFICVQSTYTLKKVRM